MSNENKEKMLPSEILLFVQCLVPFVSTTGIYRNDDSMNVCQFAFANGIPGFYICFESVLKAKRSELYVQDVPWFICRTSKLI